MLTEYALTELVNQDLSAKHLGNIIFLVIILYPLTRYVFDYPLKNVFKSIQQPSLSALRDDQHKKTPLGIPRGVFCLL